MNTLIISWDGYGTMNRHLSATPHLIGQKLIPGIVPSKYSDQDDTLPPCAFDIESLNRAEEAPPQPGHSVDRKDHAPTDACRYVSDSNNLIKHFLSQLGKN